MKINERKLGAILSYIIIVLNMIIGIAYTPFLTKMLGQSEYGLYSLVISIISYLTILDFGFGNAIIIYTSRYKFKGEIEKEQKLHGMFLVIYSIIGILAGIIGIILWKNVDNMFASTMSIEELNKAKTLMLILTFNLILTFPLSIFTSIITAYEKFVFLKILNIIRILLNPIIMILLLNFGFKSIALVVLNTIFNLGTLLIGYIYCKKNLKIKMKFGNMDFAVLKEITFYSFWIFINSIMDKINWSLDQFILGIFAGTTSVAIYSIAAQLNNMYLNFSIAISGVLLPKVAAMEEKKASDKEFSDLFVKTGRIQYLILALIITGFVLYGQEFINKMWVGPNYSQAYIIACILMIPATISLTQNIGLNIIQAKNQYKFRVIVLFIFSIINIIISIILSKKYGGVGAAIGTAISIILGQIIFMNIFYYKKTRIDIPRYWKNIIVMTIPIFFAMIIGFIIKLIFPIDKNLILLLQISMYSAIYICLVWIFAMNNYEKEIFMKPIKIIIGRKK